MLTVLADNGLRINPDKCTFAVPEVDCLGHRLTPTGLVADRVILVAGRVILVAAELSLYLAEKS